MYAFPPDYSPPRERPRPGAVRPALLALAVALGALAPGARPARAQQPYPYPQPAPPPYPVPPGQSYPGQPLPGQPVVAPTQLPGAPYRTPVIALAQLANGGTVPQDRPVVVFRFAQGEAADPLDARSLRVVVDGVDRTALFQASPSEAWGPLAPRASAAGALLGGELAVGPHQVSARICSVRGVCADATASVSVVPSAARAPSDAAAVAEPSASRKRRVLGALLGASRKVLAP